MSYRNPRFSYRHMLREFDAIGIDNANTDSLVSGSLTSLYDSKSSPLAEWTLDANKDLVLFKNAHQTVGGKTLQNNLLQRIIIPAGHTLGTTTFKIMMDLSVTIGNVHPIYADGVEYRRVRVADIDMIEIEIIGPFKIAGTLRLRMNAAADAGAHGIGEIWWTEILQPSTGVAIGWEDNVSGLYDRIETRSGSRFTQKRGTAKWRGTVEHRGLSGVDLKLYDDLFRATEFGQ